MNMQDIARQAHALHEAHGGRAEAEAAQKASREAAAGNRDEAETWERIRAHIREIRGARQT
jgi:hypothetical protein